ncbi:CoA pyrophosphatase [Flavobacteriaceae bacterium XHP0103]|uniref:NUDIX hydrolase n=1 Tax=Marixanthotalea marina TaxID=2844359 RepID=UPI002989EFF4|nr:CoA pyrophosphatase [Marixanthotalea marina]MBU3822856.1 CoA pyrophosphatase [Marixanthotalea marina]
MDFDAFLGLCPKIKNIPLPAEASHLKMVPPYRKELLNLQKGAIEKAKKAGVLALFYPDSSRQAKFVLMLRKTYKGVHSAQVSFPGGKLEKQDGSLQAAALRETHEEVGVPIYDMEVLCGFSEIYIPPSNFYVYPFLALTKNRPLFKPQDSEVELLIEVDLETLLHHEALKTSKVNTSYGVEAEVPAFILNGHVVWGATAMILSEIKDVLKQLI